MTSTRRSQAWFFPGRYVPIRHFHGVEVLSQVPTRRGGVQVAKTTIHGTAEELRSLAVQLLAAAEVVDPTPGVRPAVRTELRAA
jgi:hypothetical protein